jgi:hypothetical protein
MKISRGKQQERYATQGHFKHLPDAFFIPQSKKEKSKHNI